MNVTRPVAYYFLLLCFPVSFILHAVNENYGLIPLAVVVQFLPAYILISGGIAILSKGIFKDPFKAFVFSFALLLVYFLFGVVKDFTKSRSYLKSIGSYSVMLPLLVLAIGIFVFYLKKTSLRLHTLSKAISVFLLANLVFETSWWWYQQLSGSVAQQDFGDYHHAIIKNYSPAAVVRKPVIFWMVFDEYAASATLKKGWGFSNPLDAALQAKGFFVAGNARSNYNFTPYSITSILDMAYCKGLRHHGVVTARDMARGAFSIYDNNVVRVLEKTGYQIRNYSIYSYKNHPGMGLNPLGYVPGALVNFQTMGGRMQKDIGWNFRNVFTREQRSANAQEEAGALHALDAQYDALMRHCLLEIRQGAALQRPLCLMFHFMLPHEPFMYTADGSVALNNGGTERKENYLPQLQYTNTVIQTLTDSILENYQNKNIIVIIQGDHGFKFNEADPLFDAESCKTLYAVYCTDKDYSAWKNDLTVVNSFRMVFNKYFNAHLPLLPDTTFNVYYR